MFRKSRPAEVEVIDIGRDLIPRLQREHTTRCMLLASRAFGQDIATELHAELYGESNTSRLERILVKAFTKHTTGCFDPDVDRFVQYVMGWNAEVSNA